MQHRAHQDHADQYGKTDCQADHQFLHGHSRLSDTHAGANLRNLTALGDPLQTAQMNRKIWLLTLVPRVRHGRVLTFGVLLTALLAAYAGAGMFEDGSTAPPAVAVFFSVILAYIVPVFHYITERTATALTELAPLTPDPTRTLAMAENVGRRTVISQLITFSIGLAAGCLHHRLLSGSFAAAIENSFFNAPNAALGISTLLVWIVLMTAIFALMRNARLFAALGRAMHIDLLTPRAYTPFARVAVSSTLAIIGAQAAFPIMWIDADASAIATIPGLIATSIALVFLFALPIASIHRAIASAKRAELDRLDDLIRDTSLALPGRHDRVRLEQLNPLLAYRREIEDVSEWPFDTSVAGRLALYLIIPPLTWIGAALIEMLIDDLV